MQKFTPNLWFDGNAAEGAEFYAEVFPEGSVVGTTYYPTEGLPDFQRDMAGKELTVDIDLAGLRFTLVNAGPEVPITPAISFLLSFDPSRDDNARANLDAVWSALAEGGRPLLPLGEYPHSPHYGWVQDRFGVTWQLTLTNPDREDRPHIMPDFLFGGSAQNRAAEAMEFYTSIFPNSEAGSVDEYPEQVGPAEAGSVMFCDFTLEGQWFAAMDSRVEQDASFTEGVSLSVVCEDQAEIDRLWETLSSVPEAEQCGWCKDKFGVSWQIIPKNMAELMERPGAYAKMMGMKKLVIAGF